MKVYLAIYEHNDYDDNTYDILGIFHDPEQARNFIEEHVKEPGTWRHNQEYSEHKSYDKPLKWKYDPNQRKTTITEHETVEFDSHYRENWNYFYGGNDDFYVETWEVSDTTDKSRSNKEYVDDGSG